MKQYFFLIPTQLPSLNEVISANRSNRFAGAKMKRDTEDFIGWHIKTAVLKETLERVDEPCDILIDYFEATKRRDVDNIQSSTKFILDALQTEGILRGDSQRYVRQVYHRILQSDTDYVIVYIFPLGKVKLTVEGNKEEEER